MAIDEAEHASAPTTVSSADRSHARVPALDGIRALAIIVVLVYHNYSIDLSFRHWAGGFFGVDVFFVLSGFLITTLLLRERDSSGRIDLRRFWTRRARRLLPALYLCILLEAVLAVLVLDQRSSFLLRGDAVGSIFYFENWRIVAHASTTATHTWSLSVEEQWYLVWPLLLLGLVYATRGHVRRLAWCIGLLALASAVECALLYHGDGRRAYFGTDTRAQALLIGALLAVVLPHAKPRYSRVLVAGGWCATVFLLWIFIWQHDGSWVYRGGFFGVSVATALLIAGVTQAQRASLGRVFGARPLVEVGIISYGLYLYHIPVFLWLTTSTTHLNGSQLLGLRLLMTTAIAVASYHLVEKRFTSRSAGKRSGVAGLLVAGVLALAVIALATPSYSRVPPVTPTDTISTALQHAAEKTPKGVQRAMVLGDAPVIDLAVRSPGIFEGRSIRGALYAMNTCDVIPGDLISDHGLVRPRPRGCRSQLHNLQEVVTAFRPAYVVLMLGPNDSRDRVVSGERVRLGSEKYRIVLTNALDAARDALRVGDARFMLLPVRCAPSVPAARIDQLNGVLAQYARAHADVDFRNSAAHGCTSGSSTAGWTWPELEEIITAH